MFVGQDTIDRYYREESAKALKPAKKLFKDAGFPYTDHTAVGHIAEAISRHAEKLGCDFIVMGTRGMGTIANLVLGSVATQVIHLVHTPGDAGEVTQLFRPRRLHRVKPYCPSGRGGAHSKLFWLLALLVAPQSTLQRPSRMKPILNMASDCQEAKRI